MNIYCIQLSKVSRTELASIVKDHAVSIDIEELYRLKISGYDKIFISRDTSNIVFYTLNSSKREFRIGDAVKNLLIDTEPLGFETVRAGYDATSNLLGKTKSNRIQDELDRILDKIQNLGINSLTEPERVFLSKYKDYFD